MSISDKNQPRFVLVVILLVFGSIMAYSLNAESKPKIDVEEGEAEMDIKYISREENEVRNYPNRSVTATTYIDNESSLKFKVDPRSVMGGEHIQIVRIRLYADADIPENLHPDTFKFTFQEVNGENVSHSYSGFEGTMTDIDNGSVMENNDRKSSEIGFNVGSNEFNTRTVIQWRILRNSFGNPYNLDLHAVVGGLSEKVTATVRVHIEGGWER